MKKAQYSKGEPANLFKMLSFKIIIEKDFQKTTELFCDGGSYHIKTTSSLICRVNQSTTGFYLIETSVTKELIKASLLQNHYYQTQTKVEFPLTSVQHNGHLFCCINHSVRHFTW